MVSMTLIVPPVREPVTLDEAKAWLKLETAEDDAIVQRLITAARQMVEHYTGRVLLTQTWRISVQKPVPLPFLVLPKAPAVQLVAAFVQRDASTRVPIDLTGLWLDTGSEPQRLVLGRSWAGLGPDQPAVCFDLQFGYGDQPTSLPGALIQAVLVLVAQAYEQRCAVDMLPVSAAGPLLAPFVLRRI